jgi:hypothetical protein
LTERLRAGGFKEDSSGDAPICRWKASGLLLDVMPTNPQLLGFGSVWYQEAFETATLQTLPSGKRIHMITGPYFLACKLAAFKSRGEDDYLTSHDMEDMVWYQPLRLNALPEDDKRDKDFSARLEGIIKKSKTPSIVLRNGVHLRRLRLLFTA